MEKHHVTYLSALAVVSAAALFMPAGGGRPDEPHEAAVAQPQPRPIDMSAFSAAKPEKSLRLLFIHASSGGQLLAPPGPEHEESEFIYTAHPNGGDARRLLTEDGFEVHEASIGSEVGEPTEMFDWLPKFQKYGDTMLKVDRNNSYFGDGRRIDVVMFKSCYPNQLFVGEGEAPGDPKGPTLTYWNARATLTALLPELAKHPDVLYVYVTAPALAPYADDERVWKLFAKRVLGKRTRREALTASGPLARKFDAWVASADGWLKDYPLKNVVVFDYYDILTDHGASSFSRHATSAERDSHPSREANARAAAELVPFLNRAVRRAQLSP